MKNYPILIIFALNLSISFVCPDKNYYFSFNIYSDFSKVIYGEYNKLFKFY